MGLIKKWVFLVLLLGKSSLALLLCLKSRGHVPGQSRTSVDRLQSKPTGEHMVRSRGGRHEGLVPVPVPRLLSR